MPILIWSMFNIYMLLFLALKKVKMEKPAWKILSGKIWVSTWFYKKWKIYTFSFQKIVLTYFFLQDTFNDYDDFSVKRKNQMKDAAWVLQSS